MTQKKSHLGEKCARGILAYVDKITKVEREGALYNKDRFVKLSDKCTHFEREIAAHEYQAEEMDAEIDNLL